MWTSENRAKDDRDKLRYPSYVTDEEWAHVEPLIPRPSAAAASGKPTCGRFSTASCMC